MGNFFTTTDNVINAQFLPGDYLCSTLPNASLYLKKMAWVTDLHDGQPDRVISDGTYWKPVRPLASKIQANANQNMTLIPLMNSPTQILRGTLTAARTLTFSTTLAYPGARFRIKREATGLFGITILSAVLGANSWADYEYIGGEGWIQTASGGLL